MSGSRKAPKVLPALVLVSESNPRFSRLVWLNGQAHAFFALMRFPLQTSGLYCTKKRFPMVHHDSLNFDAFLEIVSMRSHFFPTSILVPKT